MLYKLHYLLTAAGASALNLLLGVYIKEYTDASSLEVGMLLMLMPFSGVVFRPIICSMADRSQAYQKYLMILLMFVAISYSPFIIVPFLGPEVYKSHPRICWYILLVVKVLGDIAFGGVWSIGDSLAINYAERIGTEFRVYRVWGTFSWMAFGLIIGQVNEIYFLPKYVPAFIILCLTFFMDALIVWLWPEEYFRMVPVDRSKKANNKSEKQASLLPREAVVSQMKEKVLWLISCGLYKKYPAEESVIEDQKNSRKRTDIKIDKKTQSRILMTLIRKDPRIILYLMFFVCSGASLAPLSFFFISLSNICNQGVKCDFSQLAGMLQVSMSIAETIVIVYIKKLSEKFGRLNVCAFGILLCSIKYTFYATIWRDVDPRYTLLAEILYGVCFGIYMVISVEMGHLFANEVEFILPGLVAKGVVQEDKQIQDKLKMSLAATMQSLIHSAQDGIGQGCGSLLYGLILEYYTFEQLWMIIALSAGIICVIVFSISYIDSLFKFNLGLDIRASMSIDHTADNNIQLEQITVQQPDSNTKMTQNSNITHM